MNFTVDWFSEHVPTWEKYLLHLAGTKCKCLEIGSFEGRSAVWMLDNLLTHSDARLTCVDPFTGTAESEKTLRDTYEVFTRNIAEHARRRQVTIRRMRSEAYLLWHSGPYDFVYIDGDHEGRSVVQDFVLVHRLLNEGCTVIFDDYSRPFKRVAVQPKEAIDFLIRAYADSYEVLELGKQAVLRRL